MIVPSDTIQTKQSILLLHNNDHAVGVDSLPDSTRLLAVDTLEVCQDDPTLHWGQQLELDTTHHVTLAPRFEGIRYRPRLGDNGVVQLSFLLFLIVSVVFLSRGQGHIARSLEMLRNVLLRKNKEATDFQIKLQSDEEASILLGFQTLYLYSFTIVYHFYYYSSQEIAPIPLLYFMLQVLAGAIALNLLNVSTSKIIGTLFAEKESTSTYLKAKQVMMELSGFMLWVIVLFLTYTDDLKPLLFGIVVALFLISKLIEWWIAISIFSKGLYSIFDFILYLCTAEIIPYVLFFKLIEYAYSQSI